MQHVRAETRTVTEHVAASGARFDSLDDAYRHQAAWLKVSRDAQRGERCWIGPPKLIARLARFLRLQDAARRALG